jgi:ABC-type multidrug transport system ATPase subunit
LREFVEYFAILRGIPAPEIDKSIARALEDVNLSDRTDSRMRSLSGGMLRRAGIAQAIVHRPQFLILDEPTAGLDPNQRYQLRETLQSIASTTTVLISTHLAEDIATLDAQVLVLNAGSLRFAGTVPDLIAHGDQALTRPDDPRTEIERGYSVAQSLPPIRSEVN